MAKTPKGKAAEHDPSMANGSGGGGSGQEGAGGGEGSAADGAGNPGLGKEDAPEGEAEGEGPDVVIERPDDSAAILELRGRLETAEARVKELDGELTVIKTRAAAFTSKLRRVPFLSTILDDVSEDERKIQ